MHEKTRTSCKLFLLTYLFIISQKVKVGHNIKEFLINKYHVIYKKIKTDVVDGTYYPMVDIKPRTPDIIWLPPESIKLRPPWTLPISVFAAYKTDSHRLVSQCFEFDWQCSRVEEIVDKLGGKKLVRRFKAVAREYYVWIKAGYKFYSTSGQEVPSITPNKYQEFVQETDLISKDFPQAKIELCKTASIAIQKKKYSYNPMNAIVRYEFFELVVRLSRAKYLEGNKSEEGP